MREDVDWAQIGHFMVQYSEPINLEIELLYPKLRKIF
jgi:hypothetical protein